MAVPFAHSMVSLLYSFLLISVSKPKVPGPVDHRFVVLGLFVVSIVLGIRCPQVVVLVLGVGEVLMSQGGVLVLGSSMLRAAVR